MELRSLTKAEAEIMRILWQAEKAFVKDIIEKMSEPKPAYTTVSTFLRILEKKNIVAHKTYGNTHEYYPLISEEEYKGHEVKQLMQNYFDNSATSLVSFFVNEKNMKEEELDELMDFIKENRSKKQ